MSTYFIRTIYSQLDDVFVVILPYITYAGFAYGVCLWCGVNLHYWTPFQHLLGITKWVVGLAVAAAIIISNFASALLDKVF